MAFPSRRAVGAGIPRSHLRHLEHGSAKCLRAAALLRLTTYTTLLLEGEISPGARLDAEKYHMASRPIGINFPILGI